MSDHGNPWANPKFIGRDGKLIREVDFIQLADTLDALVIQVASLAADVATLKGRTDPGVSDATLKEAMAVLTGLRNGRELHSWSGHAYMDGEIWWATFQYLIYPGYIVQLPEMLTSNPPKDIYAITDAGRAALAEYEAAHGKD